MNNREVVVRLPDALAMILRKSKAILCLVLILGFLGGIYGAYSVAKTQPRVTQKDVETAEKKVEVAENNLSKMQRALSFRTDVKIPGALQKVERAERTVSQLQEYMQNSVYYRMNPFHHGAARLCFIVESDQVVSSSTNGPLEDPRVEIVVAYTKMCPFDQDTMNHVKTIMGMEASTPYIEELISVTSDEDHRVVEICVYYDDLQKATQAAEFLYQAMTAQAEERLPKHQTIVFSTSSGYEADLEMQISHETNEASLIIAEQNLLDANAPQKRFWNWASKNFRQVLLVPGNHEFYGDGDVTARGDSWQWMIRENVGYYYNKVVRIDDTDFILTTLWSRIPEPDMYLVQRGMNDFRQIMYKGRRFTPDDFNQEHEKCLKFLKQAVEESTARHIVVVTHHLPTLKVVAAQHIGSVLNGAFATELGNYIAESRIDAWIYGHSHTNIDTTIGNTRIVCNQLGYVYYNEHLTNGFEPNKVIEL